MDQQSAQSSMLLVAIKWVAAGIVAIWVKVPIATQTLVVMMVIDYVTGVVGAFAMQKLDSREGLRGVAKKVLMLLLVAAAHYVALPLKLSLDLGSLVATGLVVNEVISVAENCSDAGVPIPPGLLDVLLRARAITGRGRDARDIRETLNGKSKGTMAGE